MLAENMPGARVTNLLRSVDHDAAATTNANPFVQTVTLLQQQKLSLAVTGPYIHHSNGHFVSSIVARNFPFHVTLAADPFAEGRALFGKFKECKSIFNGVKRPI